MADVDGPTWKVGQLARLTGLTVRTLHHYDQLGLLRPSARTPSGHRLYAEWPQLITQVQAEMDAGTDPATTKVQAEELQKKYGGPTAEQIDYIRRANSVSSLKPQS